MEHSITMYTHAYLYLIREREFVMRDQDVYKMGYTKQPMALKIGRFDGYKKGSELILIVECPITLVEQLEKDLKKRFHERFQKHDDGSEYFVGNPRRMSRMLYEASDDSWTEDQLQIKREMLKNLSNMNILTASSGTTQEQQRQNADERIAEAQNAAELKQKFKDQEESFQSWIQDNVDFTPLEI